MTSQRLDLAPMPNDGWHYATDPFGCLQVGEKFDNGNITVVGFCSPCGLVASQLMVEIKFKGSRSRFSTTRDYPSLLVQKIKLLTTQEK